MAIETNRSFFRITVIGLESDMLTLDDIGLFLTDFALLYELHRLNADPYYDYFEFSRFTLYRNRRRLEYEDKLYVEKIRYESPLEVATLIAAGTAGAIAAVGSLIHSIEKIYNFKLNRKKLELDIKNAELDAEKKKLEIDKLRSERRLLNIKIETVAIEPRSKEIRTPSEVIRTVERRLERSSVQIENIEIDFINPEESNDKIGALRKWLEGDTN